MSYIEHNLNPGESLVYETRLHWIVLFWPAVFAVVFGLSGLVLVGSSMATKHHRSSLESYLPMLALALIALAAIFAITGMLKRSATEMAVTDKRVVIKTGVLTKRTIELFLAKIESVGVEQGIMGRMFGYGSILLRGTGGTYEPFARIAAPLEFRQKVQHQIAGLQEQSKTVQTS